MSIRLILISVFFTAFVINMMPLFSVVLSADLTEHGKEAFLLFVDVSVLLIFATGAEKYMASRTTRSNELDFKIRGHKVIIFSLLVSWTAIIITLANKPSLEEFVTFLGFSTFVTLISILWLAYEGRSMDLEDN